MPRPDVAHFRKLFQDRSQQNHFYSMVRGDNDGSNGHRAWCYFEGALAMESSLLSHGSNFVFYPLFWSLRHSTELFLKESIFIIVNKGGLGEDGLENIWETHDLGFLCDRLTPLLEKVDDMHQDEWSRHETFLRHWQKADPDGAFLRYSRKRNGETSPLDQFPNIQFERSLRKAKDCVIYLRTLHEWVDDYWAGSD